MDSRIAQVTTGLALIIERDRSMFEMVKGMRKYLDGKWPRPQTRSEAAILEQLERLGLHFEQNIQHIMSMAESIRTLDSVDVRRVPDDEAIK